MSDEVRSMSDENLLQQINCFDPYDSEIKRRYCALTAENDRLKAYALEATKAITSLTPGGSEWFGPEMFGIYTANLEACVNYTKDLRQLHFDRFKEERAKSNALKARVAELENALLASEQARLALKNKDATDD